MTQAIEFTETADGLRAASVGPLVMAIEATTGGFRNLIYAGPRMIDDLTRDDFLTDGPTDQDEQACIDRIATEAKDQVQKIHLGRRNLTDEELKQLPNTEWGRADGGTYYAPGVVSVYTPSHGGMIVSSDVRETLPKAARLKNRSRIGHVPGQTATLCDFSFYEEDECWALLVLGMPSIFTDREREYAERTLIDSFPNEWEAVRGEQIPEGRSRTRETARIRAENSDKLVVVSAVYDKDRPNMVRATAALGGRNDRGSYGDTRNFLVDDDRYSKRCPIGGFIIDENIDVEADANWQPLKAKKAA